MVGFIKRVAHVVAMVAAHAQRAGGATVVVYDVHAHNVAVAEAVVVDTRHRQLVYVASKLYAVCAMLPSALVVHTVGASREQHGACQHCDIYY